MSSVVSLWVCSTVERLRSLLKSPWVWVETRCGPKLYFSFFPTEVVSATSLLWSYFIRGTKAVGRSHLRPHLNGRTTLSATDGGSSLQQPVFCVTCLFVKHPFCNSECRETNSHSATAHWKAFSSSHCRVPCQLNLRCHSPNLRCQPNLRSCKPPCAAFYLICKQPYHHADERQHAARPLAAGRLAGAEPDAPSRRPCVHTPPTRNTSFNTFPSAPYALTRHTTHRSTHIHLATPLSRHAPATHPQSSPLVNSPL